MSLLKSKEQYRKLHETVSAIVTPDLVEGAMRTFLIETMLEEALIRLDLMDDYSVRTSLRAMVTPKIDAELAIFAA